MMGFVGTIFLYAILIVVFLLFMGVVVAFVMSAMAKREINRTSRETVERILNALPCPEDGSCGKCGYASCKEYANAAVQGTIGYVPCPSCTDDMNARISLMWVKPKEQDGKDENEPKA